MDNSNLLSIILGYIAGIFVIFLILIYIFAVKGNKSEIYNSLCTTT